MRRWNSGQSPVAPQVDGVDVSKVMVSNEGKATFNKAEQQLGEHPVGGVLTAFGIGFIIAKLLDVGGRR